MPNATRGAPVEFGFERPADDDQRDSRRDRHGGHDPPRKSQGRCHDREPRPEIHRHRDDPDRHRGKIRRLYPDGRLFPGGQGPQGPGRGDQRPYPEGKSRRNESRRVVVTGMGAVSAAGIGAEPLWCAARDGTPCIGPLVVRQPYGGRIKNFRPGARLRHRGAARPQIAPFADPFTAYALVAADRSRGPGRARPAESPGLALRRSARHRRRRHAHHATTAFTTFISPTSVPTR